MKQAITTIQKNKKTVVSFIDKLADFFSLVMKEKVTKEQTISVVFLCIGFILLTTGNAVMYIFAILFFLVGAVPLIIEIEPKKKG